MNTQIYTNTITTRLHLLAGIIKTKNSLNLTDASIHAEDLFCALLNKAFSWNLVNVNTTTQNNDSFDLEDTKNNIFIQITSNRNKSAKKKASIDSFRKRSLSGKKKKFIIFFIVDGASEKVLASEEFPGFTYEGWDLTRFIKKMLRENTIASQLEPIDKMLEHELAPKTFSSETPVTITSAIGKPRLSERKKDSLHIQRDRLIDDLYNFTQAGNGLLVGGPGEGKSYLTQELAGKYSKKKGLCYIIRIDNLTSANDSDIARELNATGDWMTALGHLPISAQAPRPLLIFDAFDAAKNPLMKSKILQHIRRTIETLNEKWNILVSCRIYDAAKSTRLMELFPSDDPRKPVSCRNFQLLPLETDEIRQVLKGKRLANSFDNATPALRQILRTPYFLIIFYDLLLHSRKDSKTALETVESEEQLLDIYWKRKVRINTANTTFIQRLTELLSTRLTLACRKTEIAHETHADIIDDLVSNGVLSESGSGLNLSFVHNILLDYAISIYIIPEKPTELVRFLEEKVMHWLLFRSAYLYFLGRVWQQDRQLFWKQYEKICRIDSPRFRLFRQSVHNFVIVDLYRSSQDILSPLTKLPAAESPKILWKILEAIRFMNKDEVPEKLYGLLHDLAGQLDDAFVWVAGSLMNKAIDQATQRKEIKQLKIMAAASAEYLAFVIRRRKVAASKEHIDRNGANLGIVNFCRTMAYGKKESRKLFDEVLDILKEPEFPISIFFHLVNEVEHIADADPSTAGKIFRTIYRHVENSYKTTYLSSDVALTLQSNRAQDFQSNRYALERAFPNLLEKRPKVFLPIGVEIVNTAFLHDRLYQYGPKPTSIRVDGIKSTISPDYMNYINIHDKEHHEPSFVTNIFSYLQSLANKKEIALLRSTIKILIAKFKTASLWKELIRFISENIRILRKESFDLLSEKKLLLFGETYQDSQDLLKTAYPLLTASQKHKLRQLVDSIHADDHPDNDEETIERKKSALQACFNPESSKVLSLKTETPPQGMHFDHDPDWPVDKKAALLPQTILDRIADCKKFNDSYEGNKGKQPQQPDYLPTLYNAQEIFKFRTESAIDTQAFFDADFEISRFTKIVSRNTSTLTEEARSFSETASLFFIDSPIYRTSAYQVGSLDNSPMGFAPDPRIYSIETLVHLANADRPEMILERLRGLMSDNNQFVRTMALQALLHFWRQNKPVFWEIVSARVPVEENSLSLQILLRAIAYIDIIGADQHKVEELALSASRLMLVKEGRTNDLFRDYAILLLRLYNSFNSEVADKVLHVSFKLNNFLSSVIFVITEFIDPYDETNSYEDNATLNRNCFQLLLHILQAKFDAIGTKGISSLTADDIEPIDEVVTQLYYSVVLGRSRSKTKEDLMEPRRKAALYKLLKPLFSLLVSGAGSVESGFMVGHTAHHFLYLLEYFFDEDPQFILGLIAATVTYSAKNNLTYSASSLKTIIQITEKILVDHAEYLLVKENLDNILIILDHFADSGWPEAIELTVRLKEIF